MTTEEREVFTMKTARTIIAAYEKTIEGFLKAKGKSFSILLHKRALELIEQLEPEFKVKRLVAGMGTWTFAVEPFEVVWDDDSTSLAETETYGPSFDNLFDRPFRYMWRPTNIKENHWGVLDELREILDFINDAEHIELFEYEANQETQQ